MAQWLQRFVDALAAIFVSLVQMRHLHDFARETRLTHDERNKGLEFFRQAGQIATPQRDEFVLLSGVLGLSSLVDTIHSPTVGTSSGVLGSFHVSDPPRYAMGSDRR